MDRSNLDKIAQTGEDRLLLARLWDKIHAGMRRNIPANTCFLDPRQQQLCRYLFGQAEGLTFFGGYPDAERQMLCYLPEYLDPDALSGADAPLQCLRAVFHAPDAPSHRDFLGALMGSGIARETVGDILVSEGSCDFFVTAEIAPYVRQNLLTAGRAHLHIAPIPLAEVRLPVQDCEQIRDTLASVRLDSIISSGFRISRSRACEYIAAGKAAINGLPCEKPDKPVSQGMKISVRGLGKLLLAQVEGQSRKGRICVRMERYR